MFKKTIKTIMSKDYSTGLVLKYQKFVFDNPEYKEENYHIIIRYIGYGKDSKNKEDFKIMEQEWHFLHPVEAMAKFQCLKNKLDKLIIK